MAGRLVDSSCINGLVLALPNELIKAVVVLATWRMVISLDGSKADECGGWLLHTPLQSPWA